MSLTTVNMIMKSAFVTNCGLSGRWSGQLASIQRRQSGRCGWRLWARACSNNKSGFEIVREEELFKRYQTVYKRDIRYPNGEIYSFDITANSASEHKSVFVFPFCTKTQSATLLREYQPGQNQQLLSFVAGMYEKNKHEDLKSAARAELEEEAGLVGGELIVLAEDVPASKYSVNKFNYYLAIDCVEEEVKQQRDAEEWIQVVRGVTLDEVKSIVQGGHMNAPNCLVAMLAIEKLTEMRFSVNF